MLINSPKKLEDERFQPMSKTRDALIDILKGIGIVSVVVGHSGVLFPGGESIPSTQFVYSYHLMLFFFTAGAVYSPAKYSDPFLYIGRQLKGSVPLYWAYNFFFLAFHNVFAVGGLLDIPRFSRAEYVISGSGIFTLTHMELLGGALWFVPMLLMAKILFSVAFQVAEKWKYKGLVHVLVACCFGAVGLYTNYWGMYLNHHVQTSFLGVPVIYLGYVFARYRKYILQYANLFTCVLSAALMYWFINLNIGYVELSINSIISPYLFYPVTILGIFFAVSLAAVLQYSNLLTKLFSFLGAISFHIMALHFLAFKCFDWLYGWIFDTDAGVIMRFPTAFNNNGLAYSFVGVAFPVSAVLLFTNFSAALKKK